MEHQQLKAKLSRRWFTHWSSTIQLSGGKWKVVFKSTTLDDSPIILAWWVILAIYLDKKIHWLGFTDDPGSEDKVKLSRRGCGRWGCHCASVQSLPLWVFILLRRYIVNEISRHKSFHSWTRQMTPFPVKPQILSHTNVHCTTHMQSTFKVLEFLFMSVHSC